MRQVFTGWGVAVKRKAEKRAAYDIISAQIGRAVATYESIS